MTFLLVIDKVDTLPYLVDSSYYYLVAHDGVTKIGYLTTEIVSYFESEKAFIVDHTAKSVSLSPSLDTFELRNATFASVAQSWKAKSEFEECLAKGWRNELYTVYNPSSTPYLLLERAFSVLLGVITYGVHINGYVSLENTSNGKLKLWIPRRSPTKPTYPGKLDNTIAGGIGYPYGIWESVVKECFEEGGLPEEFVKLHVKLNGVVLYMIQPNKFNNSKVTEGVVVQPEVEYIYDLEFDNETDVVPYPEDGEAESFTLMEVDDVLKRLRNDEFKPNCGLILIDFLIRHGYITPENEPNYHELVSRVHRRMPFPLR